MKIHYGHSKYSSVLTILLISVLMTDCEWFKEDPLYVGTWQYKDKVYAGELTYNTTTTLKLTESTFEEIYLIQRDNSSAVVTLLGLKGSLKVSGNEMTFTLNSVGDCVEDAQDNCTSSVEWFAKGTTTYNNYIQYIKETVTGEFEADEDYLWLVRDKNKDGDTEDTGEDIDFDRL